ncbi:polysaccharide lyase [Allokutzneria sp. A3M-2-11 16]|uniref:polysaccharide lyase n=1 Tax=Allokutzneria sp. A3M-2-11 16 TaxID=2962043 RepID=UPI0020B774A5|nr:polysaccharide lyase [Allokutzneria sp. A3M-2-11 16]MCP3803228.1 polysaccharide lyase [Allokutzneria sp. A3M-2-11 16]
MLSFVLNKENPFMSRTLMTVFATTGLLLGSSGPALAVPLVPVGNKVVFTGNYDTGNFGQWSTCQWRGYNSSCKDWKQGPYMAKIADGGPGHATAARFEVRDGDVPPFGGGERSEVSAGGSAGAGVKAGDERWYEFSLRFDASFTNPRGGWFIPMQWHSGSGSPPLALEVDNNGTLHFANNRVNKRTEIGPIQKGRWVDYVLHVKFSPGSQALAESWVNGVKQPGVHRVPNMAGDSNYLKMGIYRDGGNSDTAILWHDGLRITAP